MRITSETLHKIARDTAQQRSRSDRDLLAIYLQGSLLTSEPLLGGTADIDLFLVHNEEVEQQREIVRLTDDVHLDIVHHPRSLYRQARELRLDPWLGYGVYNCRTLHDPQHFMDFTQASVRGQFYHPNNVLARANSQAENARQSWFELANQPSQPGSDTLSLYLRAIEYASNAVALLSGPPLPERRFLLQFQERAQAIQHAGLYNGLLGLLGAPLTDVKTLTGWLPAWREAFLAIPPEQRPVQLHLCRLSYYLHAFEAILKSNQPTAVLWPLIKTWQQVTSLLPAGSPARNAWQGAGERLGVLGEGFTIRINALDAFLDTLEEILEDWARQAGL